MRDIDHRRAARGSWRCVGAIDAELAAMLDTAFVAVTAITAAMAVAAATIAFAPLTGRGGLVPAHHAGVGFDRRRGPFRADRSLRPRFARRTLALRLTVARLAGRAIAVGLPVA